LNFMSHEHENFKLKPFKRNRRKKSNERHFSTPVVASWQGGITGKDMKASVHSTFLRVEKNGEKIVVL